VVKIGFLDKINYSMIVN